MATRRVFAFVGEGISQGTGPTGRGETAYSPFLIGTGDWIHANADERLDWRTLHLNANGGGGILAYVLNEHGPIRPGVGTSPQYPNPSLDWFNAIPYGLDFNGLTDPRNGGIWPSERFGVEVSFLSMAHGDPATVAGGSPLATLDASFSLKSGNGNSRLIPKIADLLGQIVAIATVAGSTVEITLGTAHGKTLASTFDVWIYGLLPNAGVAPDPQLRGKFTATATSTTKFTVALAGAWTGQTGKLPGGVVFSPHRLITGLSNPRDNLVRVECSSPILPFNAMGASKLRAGNETVWISGVTGTATPIDGRRSYVQEAQSWRPLIRSDIATGAAVTITRTTRTITLGAGSWTTTPAADDVVRVTGTTHADGVFRVGSATASTIVLKYSGADLYDFFRDESATGVRIELLSRSTTFAATGKTLTIGSGTFDKTLAAGATIVVQGSTGNAATFTVASATSTVITVNETVANETSNVEVWLADELEFDRGAAVDVSGWTGDGWVLDYGLWAGVFADDAGGMFPIGETISKLTVLIAKAAAAFTTEDFAPELLAILLGYNDVQVESGTLEQRVLFTSYGAALEDMLVELRTRAAAVATVTTEPEDIPLVVVQFGPTTEDSPTSPLTKNAAGMLKVNVLSIRAQTAAAAGKQQNARLVESADLPHNAGHLVYSAEGDVELGYRLWEALEAIRAGSTPASDRRGVPVYFLLGQSQTVGRSNSAFALDGDPDWDGTHYDPAGVNFAGGGYDDPPILRERLCWIWDPIEGEFQEYAAQKNANRYRATMLGAHPGPIGNSITLGPGIGSAGVEASLILNLRKRHPEGVFLYKLAINAAALQPVPGLPTFDPASADMSQAILDDWDDIRSWLHARGLIPDVRAVFFDQGESDAGDPWAGSYGGSLLAFIDWIREVLSTSSSSRAELPFVIGRLQSHDRNWAGAVEGYAAIQAAQDAAKTLRTNVGVANLQGLPIGTDNVHRTFRGIIEAGLRLGDALDQTTHDEDAPELGNGASMNPEMQAGTDLLGSPEFNPDLGDGLGATAGAGETAGPTAPTEGATIAAASAFAGELGTDLDTAIAAFLADGAQRSYTVDGFSVTREGLKDLLDARERLANEASLAQSAGGRVNYFRRSRR